MLLKWGPRKEVRIISITGQLCIHAAAENAELSGQGAHVTDGISQTTSPASVLKKAFSKVQQGYRWNPRTDVVLVSME